MGQNGNGGQGWLDSLYRRLLNRLPDAPGYKAALQFILSETRDQRLTTAFGLAFSPEYLGRAVADAYTRFLGRAASPAEVAPRVEALRRGLTQEQLVAGIAASDEALRHAGGTNAARAVGKLPKRSRPFTLTCTSFAPLPNVQTCGSDRLRSRITSCFGKSLGSRGTSCAAR